MTDRKTVIQSNNKNIEITHKETIKSARFEIVVDQIKKDGKLYPYSYVNMKSGVVILPLLDKKICVIRQFRPTLGEWIYELPAGAIEQGETPEEAAIRELYEEVGCKSLSVLSLGDTFASTGCTNEHVFLFAIRCKETCNDDQDEAEIIEKVFLSYDEFVMLVKDGSLKCATNELVWHRFKEISNDWGI